MSDALGISILRASFRLIVRFIFFRKHCSAVRRRLLQ